MGGEPSLESGLMKIKYPLHSVLCMSLILWPFWTHGAQSYKVDGGTSQEITEHGVCREVINTLAHDLFVPTHTAGEWSSFYNNPPTGVAVAACPNDWYNSSWDYRVKITIDHTKVGDNLTNFPVLITESHMPGSFWTNVQATGADIVVTSNDGQTKLDRELVSINTSSPAMELHVRVPTLLGGSPTILFLYYGNASASESNSASTWSAYRNVYHMGQTTPIDSTGTTATNNVSGGTITAGKMGNGLSFSGSGRIDFASNITNANFKSLSFWYYPRSRGGGNFGSVFGSSDYNNGVRHVGEDPLSIRRGGSILVRTTGTFNVWKHIVMSYDSGTGQVTLYENGTAVAPVAMSNWYTLQHLVAISNDAARAPDGILDEMRIKNAVFPPTWPMTEYNNQDSPGTFYAVGDEIPKPL